MNNAAGLQTEILRFAAKYNMFKRGDKVLIALSGGADSVALTLLLSELADKLGIEISAAHLNHGLRGEESDRDERFVRSFCEACRIPLTVGSEAVAEIAATEGSGIEETARKVRYGFLRETAERLGCAKIATAHNANDNAETMLLNLIRGTGVRGLSGIPPVRGNIVRPLLCATRETIEKFLSGRDAGFVQDSTNFDTSYTRNKIRHKILPVISEINPSFAARALETAELLRNDADFLDSLAEKFPLDPISPPEAECSALIGSGNAVAGRVVRRMYRIAAKSGASPALSKTHVDSVLALTAGSDPSGRADLPNGIEAKRKYDKIAVGPTVRPEIKEYIIPIIPLTEGETRFGDWVIRTELITEGSNFRYDGVRENNTVLLRQELLKEGTVIRTTLTGDAISPVSRSWTKKLKKLYIDLKIPLDERAERPVIACKSGVCAVPGFAADRKYAASSTPFLQITFNRE